jgi:hypothetical protein
LNLAALAWLEADCGTTRNVEAESERSRPVERHGTVDLEEMVMSADLDRAITDIYDFDLLGLAPGIDLDRALSEIDCPDSRRLAHVKCFVGDHRCDRRRR